MYWQCNFLILDLNSQRIGFPVLKLLVGRGRYYLLPDAELRKVKAKHSAHR